MAEVKNDEEEHAALQTKRKSDPIDTESEDSIKKQKLKLEEKKITEIAQEFEGEDEEDNEVDDEDDEEEESDEIDLKGKGIMKDDKGKGKLVEESDADDDNDDDDDSDDDDDDDGSESDDDSDLSDDPLAEVDLDNILPSRTRRRSVQAPLSIKNDVERKD